MKVLLLDNVDKLGVVGDIVDVKRGYASNYLMPRRLAVLAKENTIKAHQAQVDAAREKMEQQKSELQQLIEKIDGIEYKLEKKVNKDNKMFGSVSQKDIKTLMAAEKIDWDLVEIDLSKIKKELAKYPVELKFPYDLSAKIILNLVEKK